MPVAHSHRKVAALVFAACAFTVHAWMGLFGSSGCYDYTLTEDAGAEEDADAGAADAGDARTPHCLAGAYYCGGSKLVGRPDTIYRCSSDGSGVLVERCANGCLVGSAGKNDKCSPPTACKVGGAYCGGDKINGDPDVLYRCLSGGAIEIIRRCPKACVWKSNDDDDCG